MARIVSELEIMANKINQCPLCNNLKDARSKQCKKCRKKEQQSTKGTTRAHRYNKCPCGTLKDKRAKRCIKCELVAIKAQRAARSVCKCGSKKSEKSPQCMACFRESISNIKNGKCRCTICNKKLPLTDFYKKRSGKYLRSLCKRCSKTKARSRGIRAKCAKYGATMREAELIAKFNYIRCPICNQKTNKFHIDHCHKTMKFRGLLCSNCNSGIGLLMDNPIIVKNAYEYLNKFLSDNKPIWPE